MTFLEIVQRAYGLASLQGSVNTVTDPGFVSTLQRCISQAWTNIQNDQTKDFTFMEAVDRFDTTISKHTYSPDDMFGVNSSQYGKLMQIEYHRYSPLRYCTQSEISDIHKYESASAPAFYCDDLPDGSIIINIPDKVYSLKISYKKVTQEMIDDTNIFSGPYDAVNVVIYSALQDFGAIIGDVNLVTMASQRFDDLYPAMCSAYNRVIETRTPDFII